MSDNGRTTVAPADVVWLLLGLPALGLAVVAALGVGFLRGGAPVVVWTVAIGVVVLPVLGITMTLPIARRVAVAGPVAAAWASLLLWVFPLYFPGERAAAIDLGAEQGLASLGVALPFTGEGIDPLLPGLPGRPPSPEATPAVDERLVLPSASEGASEPSVSPPPRADEIILPYEGSGTSLVVPVGLEHQGAEVDVSMIFDTGASFTSVDSETLRALGVRVPADAPEVMVRTANGERVTRLVLIDTVWLGGLAVEGVTVGLCDACAHEEEVGLLGLNVSGRFLVTVDQQTRELRLRPREHTDRTADVRYWVEPAARATAWPDGRIDVEVTLANHSPRVVRGAVVRIGCDDGYDVKMPDIPPGETGESRVNLRTGAECEGYTVELRSAGW